jgi:hypothetical protein
MSIAFPLIICFMCGDGIGDWYRTKDLMCMGPDWLIQEVIISNSTYMYVYI